MIFLWIFFLLALVTAGVERPKTFVVGDLHGDFQMALEVFSKLGLMNQKGIWTGGNVNVIQTGDIADRGPYSAEMYRWFSKISKEAEAEGGRIDFLSGNHELFLMCGIYHYLNPEEFRRFYNGNQKKLDHDWSSKGFIGNFVRQNFQSFIERDGTIFVHAGLIDEFSSSSPEEVKTWALGHMDGESGCTEELFSDTSPFMTRQLGHRPIQCDKLYETLRARGAQRMVVGHTPTDTGRIGIHCDGRLIHIDTAISRWIRGTIAVVEIAPSGEWFEILPLTEERESMEVNMTPLSKESEINSDHVEL